MTTKFTLIDNLANEGENLPTDQSIGKPFTTEESKTEFPKDFANNNILIKVCGIGGGGGNAINRMIEAGMRGVDFVAINTDCQALSCSLATIKVQIGDKITGGLGAGCIPEIGSKSAIEDKNRIKEAIEGANMVFLTAGMGGGTGTGATPIVAEIAKSLGILTIAVVTLPFSFEGESKITLAKEGIKKLKEYVDALIVIPNDNVADISDMSVPEAFLKVDEILHNGIRSVTDLITRPQLLNVDFADIRTVLQRSGQAHFGIGIGKGENRAEVAVMDAINSDLLRGRSVAGARSAILSVHGGSDMKIGEVKIAGNKLMDILGNNAIIKLGATIEKEPMDTIKVTLIIAGFPESDSYIHNTHAMSIDSVSNLSNIPIAPEIPSSISTNFNAIFEPKKITKEQNTDTKPLNQSIINNKMEKEVEKEKPNKYDELFPKESYTSPNKEVDERQKSATTDIPSWLKKYISR